MSNKKLNSVSKQKRKLAIITVQSWTILLNLESFEMERSREDSLRAILKVKDWNSEQQKHEALVDHLQVGEYRFGQPRPGRKYLQVYTFHWDMIVDL